MNNEYWSEISYYLSEIDQQRSTCCSKKISTETIFSLRNQIISSLEQLKDNLEQLLDESHVHFILFALVALVDEEMQCQLPPSESIQWTPIQRDFYDTTNAGELFYKTLDEILDNSNIPTIVYEVFYFVLKRGFRGKHAKSASRINRYLTFLSEKIPVEKGSFNEEAPLAAQKHNEKKTHRGLLYGATFASLLAIYGLLYFFSH
jgi:type IV/VI secretion system ImpK/VasF family protein